MQFPKLLVVTEYPPNSPTLDVQLLKGYPSERLFWWSCKPEVTSVYGQKYARHFSGRLPQRLLPHQRYNEIKCSILERFWIPYATRHLQKTIAEVQPDQVWLNLYGWAIGPIHFADSAAQPNSHVSVYDFPDTLQIEARWGSARCQRALDWVHSVYKRAASCSVISEGMREDLAHTTGRDNALILHSGLEDADLDRLSKPLPLPDGTLRIAYAGGILVPEVFALFVRTMEKIRHRLKTQVRLEFFGGGFAAAREWFNPSWMHDHGVLEESELMEKLWGCTWGFLPMELSDANPRYNQFSFPNKFGTYLAAGLPILLLSSPTSSAARMLEQHRVGVNLQPEKLESHLTSILNEPNIRKFFHDALLTCGRTEFYMPRIRESLWRKLGVRFEN